MPSGASGRAPALPAVGDLLPIPPGGLLQASETGRAGVATGMGLSARPVPRSAPLPGDAGVAMGGVSGVATFPSMRGILLLLDTVGSFVGGSNDGSLMVRVAPALLVEVAPALLVVVACALRVAPALLVFCAFS